MNLRAGYPFWLVKNGLPYDYPKLERSLRTDVLILGGGISGALAAHHLVKAGFDCIVVDARTIGLGSTCASTALLQYEIDVPLSKLIELVGYDHAERAYKLCEKSIGNLSRIAKTVGFAEFEWRKSLYYAAHKKDIPFLKEEFDARQQAGFRVHYLEEADIRSRFSFSAPAAILSESGAQVNAYLFTHHLHQHNITRGLRVFDRSKVMHIAKNKQRCLKATLENGCAISARKVVNATGYEVINFIHKKIVKLHSTYATAGEQNLKWKCPWEGTIIWNTADPYLYLRNTADGRIIIGGRDEQFFTPTKRDALIDKKSKLLARDFKKLFPSIDFKPEFSWTGVFGSTADGLPFIGEYKRHSGIFYSLGFGGNGITFSEVAAGIITDMLKGKKNKDAELFAFDRI